MAKLHPNAWLAVLLLWAIASTAAGCDNCLCGACDDELDQRRTVPSQVLAPGEQLVIPLMGAPDAVYATTSLYSFFASTSMEADSVVTAELTSSRYGPFPDHTRDTLVVTAVRPGSGHVHVRAVGNVSLLCDERPLSFMVTVTGE